MKSVKFIWLFFGWDTSSGNVNRIKYVKLPLIRNIFTNIIYIFKCVFLLKRGTFAMQFSSKRLGCLCSELLSLLKIVFYSEKFYFLRVIAFTQNNHICSEFLSLLKNSIFSQIFFVLAQTGLVSVLKTWWPIC